jgi:L-fucose mutarotase/ribose pyranase (RbsD/FucU family)
MKFMLRDKKKRINTNLGQELTIEDAEALAHKALELLAGLSTSSAEQLLKRVMELLPANSYVEFPLIHKSTPQAL